MGLIDGNTMQIAYQLAGVLVAWAIALIGTVVILRVVDAIVGLRVSEEHEIQGLDLSLHGGEATISDE